MLGGVAKRFSSRRSHARATLPTPIALRARNRRRDHNPIPPPANRAVKFIGDLENIDETNSEGNSKNPTQIPQGQHFLCWSPITGATDASRRMEEAKAEPEFLVERKD